MAPSTSFASHAQEQIAKSGGFPEPYADFAGQTMAALQAAALGDVTTAQDVAEAVFRAATIPTAPL
jgi:hypothetical protein